MKSNSPDSDTLWNDVDTKARTKARTKEHASRAPTPSRSLGQTMSGVLSGSLGALGGRLKLGTGESKAAASRTSYRLREVLERDRALLASQAPSESEAALEPTLELHHRKAERASEPGLPAAEAADGHGEVDQAAQTADFEPYADVSELAELASEPAKLDGLGLCEPTGFGLDDLDEITEVGPLPLGVLFDAPEPAAPLEEALELSPEPSSRAGAASPEPPAPSATPIAPTLSPDHSERSSRREAAQEPSTAHTPSDLSGGKGERSPAALSVPAPAPIAMPPLTAALPRPPLPAASEPPAAREPIRTRTMAILLASQGHRRRALSIYDELLAKSPSDESLRAEAEALRSRPE